MATLSKEGTIRQFENLRSEMVNLKSKLAVRVHRESDQLERLAEEGDGLEMQPKLPDKRKAALADKLVKLKLNILDIKIARLDYVLSELRTLPSCKPPQHLSWRGFENWIQSNEILYELQSREMAVQSQKRNLEKLAMDEQQESAEAASMTPRTRFKAQLGKIARESGRDLIINKSLRLRADTKLDEIRSHLRSLLSHNQAGLGSSIKEDRYLEKSFLDELFSLDVSNASFEGRKLREYLTECQKEGDNAEQAGQHPTGVHPVRYREYTQALCDYVVDYQLTHHGNDLAFDTVHFKIESNLMPAIRSQCLEHVRARREDEIISSQCEKYRGVTQSEMAIPRQYQSDEVIPYGDAISRLKATYFSLTPGRKLYDIISAAHAVFDKLADEAAGADIFMDIWCYVVLKANVPNLATTCSYILEYCNPALVSGEGGYFLSSLQLASQYIMTLTDDKLVRPVNMRPEQFVTCDIPRYQRLFAIPDSPFVLTDKTHEMSGYKAFVVKEWYFDPTRLWRSLLVPSDPTSVVCVAVVNVKTGLSTSQNDFIKDTVSRDRLKGTGCQTLNTPLGSTVGIQKISDLQSSLTLFSLPNGGQDPDEWQIIDTCLTLERMAVPLPEITLGTNSQACGIGSNEDNNGSHVVVSLTDAVYQCVNGQFRNDFGITGNDNLTLVIRPIIETCQVILQHLGYLTTLSNVDGIYSDLVMEAVRRFQFSHNEGVSGGSLKGTPLAVTGHLNKATYESLQITLQNIRLKMDRLGLVCSVDPCSVANAATFRQFISGCQKAWSMTLSIFGTLDKMTLKEIDRQLRLLNPKSNLI